MYGRQVIGYNEQLYSTCQRFCGGDNDLWESEWKPNLDYCYIIKSIFEDEY